MALATIVVGSNRRPLNVTIKDENGAPVNITAASLQGRSADLPAVTINAAGTITDGPGGAATFGSIGTLVTQGQLTGAAIKLATFKLSVKYTDNAAKIDFTDEFEIIWRQDPLQPV